ncbi:MAG: hypothetical protein ABI036_06320 [Fibrobacteria bacterium]
MAYRLLAILALILSGCERKPSPLPDPAPSAQADSAAQAKPEKAGRAFSLILSSGGGFAGLYAGCTLASDGTVTHWQRFRGRDTILAAGMGSPDTILSLRGKLEASGALSLHENESGNMTTRVELKAADSTYSWSWSGSGVNEKTPPALKTWYVEADAYCQSFQLPASERK